MNQNQPPMGHVGNARQRPDLRKEVTEDLLSKIDDSRISRGRIAVCIGCNAEKNGVKSRIGIPHTCGK